MLSLRLFQLVQEHPPTERLLSEAMPRMHALVEVLGQSCHLGVLEGGRVVILAQTNAPGSVGFYVKAGSSVDLMQAASGQAILAYLPAEARRRVIADWEKETGDKVPANFTTDLERIRHRGYERRSSYQVGGIVNISAPIMGRPNVAIAALTVPYIQKLQNGTSLKATEQALLETANNISCALGVPPQQAAGG